MLSKSSKMRRSINTSKLEQFLKSFLAQKLPTCLFVVNIFLSSCSPSKNELFNQDQEASLETVSKEDLKWMERFFNELFFDTLNSTAIYTVFGSKPLSSILIVDATEEEWLQFSQPYLEGLSKDEKEKRIRSIKEQVRQHDFPKNWQKFKSWKKKFPLTSILFVERPTKQIQLFEVYILNTQQALWKLHQYYNIFRDALQRDFDPHEEILCFEDPESAFWGQVFTNDRLSGLLYGMGEKNTFLFSYQKNHPNILLQGKNSTHIDRFLKEKKNLKTLSIPPFVSYEPFLEEDPVVIRFQRERKLIQQSLKGKNLTEESIRRISRPWVQNQDSLKKN